MAHKIERAVLAQRIRELDGLTNDERSALLELLNTEKRYGLVWENKPEDVEERLRECLPVLTEVKERAIINGSDYPNHIIIEGDNLEALTALTYTHEGKIDVIYIDPPYNTGNRDFVYNDNYFDTEDCYRHSKYVDAEDGYRHSKWLSFMSRRLKIAKRLLSDKGVIFISIDDNEQANLKLLCDEVFGEKNMVASFIIIRSEGGGLAKQAVIGHDYLLTFAKNIQFFSPLKRDKEIRDKIVQWNGEEYLLETDWLRKEFGKYGTCPYEDILKYFDLKKKQEIDEGLKDGKYRLIEKDNYHIVGRLKKLEDASSKLYTIQKFLNKDGLNLMRELGLADKFSYPKPNALIREMIYAATFSKKSKNAIILDFFAGSGTTLHSVMELNIRDKGHRQCILVTNNENNICEEVTYERNKRVINGYTTPRGVAVEGLHENNLRYYRTEFLPRERTNTNMRALVKAATDLLCIKEDLYDEEMTLGSIRLKPSLARLFRKGDQQMLVIYREEVIFRIVEELEKLEFNEKLKVYLFAPGRYAFDDDFITVQDKVSLCALPAAIYDAYQKVLPKRKIKLLPEFESQQNAELNFEEGRSEQ